MTNEELFELAKAGDKDAERELFVQNQRFSYYLAKKYESTGVEKEELVSLCNVGLAKAYRTFNPDKKVKFITYASMIMENEIRLLLRKAYRKFKPSSLDEIIRDEGTVNGQIFLSDVVGELDKKLTSVENIEFLEHVFNEFLSDAKPRQKLIFKRRFLENCTQQEVANELGLSQSWIHRMDKRISDKIIEIANEMVG